MKRFLLFALSAFLLAGCSRLTTNDWQADELKGSVSKVTTTTGEAVGQGDTLVFGKYTYTEIIEYDKNGLKLHARTLNEDGSLNLQCRYEHDKRGNITVADMRDANDLPIMRNNFEYDDNGRLSKMTSVDPDGHTDMTVVYENDSSGKQVKQTVYDHLGRVVYSEPIENSEVLQDADFEYDEHGNWIRKITFHTDSVGTRFPTFMWIREIKYYN